MKYLVFFLLCIPFANAYSVAVSPDIVFLDENNKGTFSLINPNNKEMNYNINGLLKEKDKISPNSIKKFEFQSDLPGDIFISFQDKNKKQLSLMPSLILEVKQNQKKKKINFIILIICALGGFILLALLKKLNLSYFSSV